jgi:hypothetical protein
VNITEKLIEIFREKGSGPFLFVGSGFSRRYLGLEDWRGLLSKFSLTGQPFEYFLAKADGNMPSAAKLLAYEFNEFWWTSPEFAVSVARHKTRISNSTSALRIEICNYLTAISNIDTKKVALSEELEILSSLNVDGIITTNWDTFLEQLFPDYRKYVGQNELLFSTPQEIGEIYKIHGCATRPESLILTSDDYALFNEKNPYLAAKLITVFVEHPVVFVGYSISDENVASLLRSISLCVGRENIEKLRRNLIFVQRLRDNEKPGISDTYITIDGVQIPLVLVSTNDFSEVYKAMSATSRKIPARILRYCKEQLYELVKSLEPEKKLCVLDFDEIEDRNDVEFLVGLGVAKSAEAEFGNVGYDAIEVLDLISDLLLEDRNFDANRIVQNVIKRAGRNTPNVPVFKYLHAIGIKSVEDYEASGLPLDKWVIRELKDFRLKAYKSKFFARRHQTMQEIIDTCTPEVACFLIPYLSKDRIDLDLLKEFLVENFDKFDYTHSYASYFRKLIAIYDRLKWGW